MSSKDCDLENEMSAYSFFKKHKKFNILMLATVNKKVANNFSSYFFNVQMLLNLIWFCKGKVKRFIFASTADVYGNKNRYKTTETDPVKPDSFYGKSKYLSERIIRDLLPRAVILRLCGIYGTGTGLLDKEEITLNNDGKNLRHFVHVEDLSNIFDIFLNSNHSGIFNVANPVFKSMKEWTSHIKQTFCSTKTDRDFDLTFDTRKLTEAIGDYQWKY